MNFKLCSPWNQLQIQAAKHILKWWLESPNRYAPILLFEKEWELYDHFTVLSLSKFPPCIWQTKEYYYLRNCPSTLPWVHCLTGRARVRINVFLTASCGNQQYSETAYHLNWDCWDSEQMSLRFSFYHLFSIYFLKKKQAVTEEFFKWLPAPATLWDLMLIRGLGAIN